MFISMTEGESDKRKERAIALYLASFFNTYSSIKEALAMTTPYPEMARDLLKLVRDLDKL